LRSIQEEFAKPGFEGVMDAIGIQLASLTGFGPPRTRGQFIEWIQLVGRFTIRTNQLRRLHLVAGNELRTRLAAETKVNNQRFFAFLAVMLIASGLAVFRLLSHVNRMLANERRSRDELQAGNKLLEAEIKQRQELSSQLRQAQKMEAIGKLSGGIAHDFNNMLTIILGHAELAAARIPEGSDVRQSLEAIETAGEGATRLIAQLLAFSRKQVLAPRIIDMNDVIANIEEMLARTLGAQIELETTLAPDLWHVRADEAQLGQVAMNLAVNARDAMPAGGRLIIKTSNETVHPNARSRPDVDPGDYVSLSVTDTGAGMDDKTLEQVFDPFFTTKEVGSGTGLGLSTVYGIVKQSGGDVSVRSQPGDGTTFEILLPRASAALDRGEEKQRSSSLRSGTGTILIVEDDAAIRDLVSLILQKLGYRCIEAPGPLEALQRIDEGVTFDLMITDMVMPIMNGD